MWYARIDTNSQQFVIEDEENNLVATRAMPTTILPNPGQDILMSKEDNQKAWNLVRELVRFANRGLS